MQQLKINSQCLITPRCINLFLIASSAALAPHNALALNYDFTVFGDATHESNSTLLSPKVSDLNSTLGGRITALQERSKLIFNANYDIAYTDYKNGRLTSRTQANGSSQFNLTLVERSLSWDLAHDVVELTSSRSDPDTLNNRRRRNAFTTGPTLRLAIGQTDEIAFSASYSHIDFNNAENENTATPTDPDSEQRSGTVSWQHALSPISQLSANYQYAELERDNLQQTTKFNTAYIGYSKQLQHADYRIQIGSNSSQIGSSEKKNNAYYLAEYNQDFSGHQLSLSASQQKTSSALGVIGFNNTGGLRNQETDNIEGTANTLQNFEVTDNIEITFFDISYEANALCGKCTYLISYSYVDNDFEVDDRNNQVNTFNANFNYRINRRLTSQISSNHSKTDFDSTSGDPKTTNKDTISSLHFTWQQNPRLSFKIGGRYKTRNSDLHANYSNASGFIAFDYIVLSDQI